MAKKIEYSIEELDVLGYKSEITEVDNRFIIRNVLDLTVHGPEEMVIGVKKVWEDDNNRDKVRPDEIRVNLFANNRYYKGYILNEDNNWQIRINNLTNANGKIKYSWEEEIPDNYANKVSEENGITTITNSYTPEVTSATVQKVWEDSNNQDRIRSKEVTVVLFANNEKTDKTLALSDENDWHGTISNLPKNENGQEIIYTFKLKEVIDKYTTTYAFENEVNKTIITSSYTPEETKAIVTNEWIDDDNRDGIRPEEIEVILMNKEHIVLDTENNPVILKLSKENQWSGAIEHLPKYTDGIENNYIFKLKENIAQYTSTYEYDKNTTKIINKHIPEQITLEVQKEWIDNNNQDGIRPEEVSVILLKNGTPTDIKLVLNKDNNWSEIVKNQFKYENGTKNEYKFVLESAINEYKTDYKQEDYKTIIISEHIPEEIILKVEKKWIDDNDKDGYRPNEVIVVLVIDGKPSDIKLTLNQDNDWYSELSKPKYKDGKEIQYKFVLEKNIDKYITEYFQDKYSTIITSEYNPEKVKLEIQVIWDDLDNKFNKRPDEVIVRLYINGEPSNVLITLNKDNDWHMQLETMLKYKNGKEIEYKFVEDVPKGYKESYEYDISKTIITNFLREEVSVITPSETTSIEESKQVITKPSVIEETTSSKEETIEKVKTDDNSNLLLFYILSLITSFVLFIKYKKK